MLFDKDVDFSDLYPKQKCHKCGQDFWEADIEPLTWHCVYCGNLIYYTLGTLKQQIDVVFNADDIHLSAQEESEDMYASIDKVLDKIDVQLRKLKDKEKDRRKGKLTRSQNIKNQSKEELYAEGSPNIVMSDNYIPKPITIEDAAVELQKSDQNFVVFFNADTKRVNVLYKKKNGDFGLIDPRV